MNTCPWDGWEPASVSFCEARLCAIVAEPSNAWSSMGYVILGIWLLTRPETRTTFLLAGVALANVAIGLGSFAFHASGTFAGELIDLFGMFLLSGLMLAYALGRTQKGILGLWAAFTLAPMALVLLIKPAGIPLFALELVTAVVLELRARRPKFKLFLYSLAMVTMAFTIWITDTAKILCAPDNHFITGHAIWHGLNAVGICFLYFFYAAQRTE